MPADDPPGSPPSSTPPTAALVWAKMGKWPWWPATVQVAPLQAAVPGGVPSCWVRFCGTHDAGWCALKRLRLWVDWEQPEQHAPKLRQMRASYDAALAEARSVASGEGPEMEQVLQVKRLKAQRISPGGQRQFLVQWESKNDLYADTWEDADHILDPELIKDLEEREEKQRNAAEPTNGGEPARKRMRCRECEACMRPPCGALGLVKRGPLPTSCSAPAPFWLHLACAPRTSPQSAARSPRSIVAAPNVAPVVPAGDCKHCLNPALRQACKLRVCKQMSAERPAEQPRAEPQYPTVRIKMRGADSTPALSSSLPPQQLWQPASSSASPEEDEELPSWACWGKEEDANDTGASHARTAAAEGRGSSCQYCALVIGPGGNLRQHEQRCLAQHQAVEAARAACAACGGKKRKHTCVAVARSGGGGVGKQAGLGVVAVEVVGEDTAGSHDAESATVVEVEEQLPLQFSLVEALCKLHRSRPTQQSAASGESTVVQPPKNIYVLMPHNPGSGFWMSSDLVSI